MISKLLCEQNRAALEGAFPKFPAAAGNFFAGRQLLLQAECKKLGSQKRSFLSETSRRLARVPCADEVDQVEGASVSHQWCLCKISIDRRMRSQDLDPFTSYDLGHRM
jgi:hypothetical protein